MESDGGSRLAVGATEGDVQLEGHSGSNGKKKSITQKNQIYFPLCCIFTHRSPEPPSPPVRVKSHELRSDEKRSQNVSGMKTVLRRLVFWEQDGTLMKTQLVRCVSDLRRKEEEVRSEGGWLKAGWSDRNTAKKVLKGFLVLCFSYIFQRNADVAQPPSLLKMPGNCGLD